MKQLKVERTPFGDNLELLRYSHKELRRKFKLDINQDVFIVADQFNNWHQIGFSPTSLVPVDSNKFWSIVSIVKTHLL